MLSEKDQLLRLAQYLRRHPAAVNMTADAVAAECQVPVELVRNALRDVPRASQPGSTRGADTWRHLQRLGSECGAFVDRMEPHFLWFISLTILIPLGILVLGSLDGLDSLPGGRMLGTAIGAFFGAVLGLSLLILQPLLMGRYCKWSWVWKGALVAWLSMWAVMALTILREERGWGALMGVFALGFAFVFVALMLAGLNAAAVLMSSYLRLKGEDRRAAAMTRQDLLQRLFEIEEALNQGGTPTEAGKSLPAWEWTKENQLWITPIVGFLLSFASTALIPEPNMASRGQFTLLAVILLLFGVLLTLVGLASQIALAFMGGDLLRSLRNSYLFAASGLLATGLIWALQEYAHVRFVKDLDFHVQQIQFNALAILVVASLIGVFAGLGAFLRDRRRYNERLRQNDPQTLLAELVEIQRRLSPTQGMTCVMVIDAARSSMMKANAQDAQVAEWSFRAYQQFLKDIIESEGGQVHSVAGDGAVALFGDTGRAYHASRRVQTEILVFNSNINRLKDPFRLRIGLHADMVAGDLNEVQFAASIDIAAHVEKVSQVGGIAVTRTVADALPDHRFAELAEMVDDQIVLLSLNPTLDPE